MDRKALALHWRPDNFTQVVGHKSVIAALTNSLSNNRLHHAYLFAGTRGVGKTTLARILAKNLNCRSLSNGVACDKCKSCIEIKSFSSVDVIEIDAASNTKVEDMRSLLDKVIYLPVHSKYKIYLIDEVHMLSNHSFNALLKTLEEPPEHVKFILATTEPDKLPATILSRCLQFHLSNLTELDITCYLEDVLTHEKVKYELDALQQIARLASGSMRDALSMADQALAVGNKNITPDIVNNMLGIVGLTDIYNLVDLLVCQQREQLWQTLEKITAKDIDIIHFLDEIIIIFQQIAAIQHIPKYTSYPSEHLQIINKIVSNVSVEDTQLIYQIAIVAKQDIVLAPDHKAGLYMTFIRMLEFQRVMPSSKNITTSKGKIGSVTSHQPEDIEVIPADKQIHLQSDSTQQAEDKDIHSTKLKVDAIQDIPPRIDLENNIYKWRDLIENLDIFGVTKVLLKQSSVIHHTSNLIKINMQSSVCKLWNNKHQERVQKALNKYYDNKIEIIIVIQDKQDTETVTTIEKKEQDIKHTELLSIIAKDEHINYIKKRFNASLDNHKPLMR